MVRLKTLWQSLFPESVMPYVKVWCCAGMVVLRRARRRPPEGNCDRVNVVVGVARGAD